MNLTDAVVGLVKAVSRRGRIERLCAELGWSIDERDGDTLGFRFKCPASGQRMVYVGSGDEILVLMLVNSHVIFDPRRVPDEVSHFALFQNSKSLLGKWEPRITGDGMRLMLGYTALGDGLTADLFQRICEDMVKTASTFDDQMRERGWV